MADAPAPVLSQARAAARALKDRCYAAWHTDPGEAVRCADALAELAADAPGGGPDSEIAALVDWTGAIADLIHNRLARAVQRLDAAQAGFLACGLVSDAALTQVPKLMGLALQGRFDEALVCAGQARDQLLALGDRRSAAKVVLNTGSLCMQQDRYAEAAAHYRQATVLFARLGDREHSVMADMGRADALFYQGETAEAAALYQRSVQRAQAHGLPVLASAAAQALAELALARGRYAEALAGLGAASRHFARLNLPLRQVEAEKALADAYAELRLLPEAAALYDEVHQRLDEGSATKPWVWLQQARLAGGGTAAEAALAQAQRLFVAMDNAVGLAALQLVRAEQGLQAMAGAADAGAMARAALQAARNAGERYARLGLPAPAATLAVAEAETACGDATAALARLDDLVGGTELPLPQLERACLLRGRALQRLGRPDEARRAFERAVEFAEAGRTALPGDDLQRAYLGQRAGAYEELLRLALADHEVKPGDGAAWAVLQAAEQLRARTLRDRLGLAGRARAHAVAPADERAARERLDVLYRRLNRVLHDGQTDEAPAALHDERRRLEQGLLERARRRRLAMGNADHGIAADGTDRPAAGLDPRAVDTPAALHAALPDGSALVVYAVLDDELFALTARAGHLQLHRHLARWTEVLPALSRLGNHWATQRLGAHLQRHAELLADRCRKALGIVFDQVWWPLQDALDGAEAVQVVPCGALASLPFAALWDGQMHLVERHRFGLLASVDALLNARPVAPLRRRVALADTHALAGAADEVAALAASWPGLEVHTGAAASGATLRQVAAGADLLHLACHGEFRADSPLFSALHLSDGAFTALDAEALSLDGCLVVLSACETALADAARDDEALGLVRAFLIAGASRVLGGLWAVDDAATARWMGHFHARLAAGKPPAQAVAEVQRRCIANGAHPFAWAGFALHGRA